MTKDVFSKILIYHKSLMILFSGKEDTEEYEETVEKFLPQINSVMDVGALNKLILLLRACSFTKEGSRQLRSKRLHRYSRSRERTSHSSGSSTSLTGKKTLKGSNTQMLSLMSEDSVRFMKAGKMTI